jgi:CheY-like chemotaxis protein
VVEKSKPDNERTALLADDEPGLRAVLTRALHSFGWHVLEARDGLSAIRLLDEHGAVDAVIADLHMPGLAGSRLLEHARSLCPGARLVLLSGWPTSWAVAHAERLGALVLIKPIEVAELYEAIGA